MYVKDSNGKYRLVEKDANQQTIVETKKALTLEEIEARLRRVEGIVIGPQKK